MTQKYALQTELSHSGLVNQLRDIRLLRAQQSINIIRDIPNTAQEQRQHGLI